MKTAFSFAAALHRVFDCAPPGQSAVFAFGEQRLFPYEKPDGLYVFTGDLPGEMCVRCGGYLPVAFSPKMGEVQRFAVFPAPGFLPPPGWKTELTHAEPGRVLALPDPQYSIRVTGSGKEHVRLRTRPGFTGGCLLWSREERRIISLILEKQPPDSFLLDRMPPDPEAGWTVQRVYPGMADETGRCVLVVPVNFETDLKQCEERIEWGTQ